MTFGRPSIIPAQYVQLAPPEDIHLLRVGSIVGETATNDPVTTEPGVEAFKATIRLYAITAQILSTLYHNNVGCAGTTTDLTSLTCHVLQLQENLDTWKNKLDPSLHLIDFHHPLPQVGSTNRLNGKFRVVLTLRYHNLNILLHRPILSLALSMLRDNDSDTASSLSALSSAVIRAVVESSIQSAMQIIDLVHTIMHAEGIQRDLLGAWWFALYYSESSPRSFSCCGRNGH